MKNLAVLFSFVLFVTAAVFVSAQNKNTELTSAEEIASLNTDFSIQGEYLNQDGSMGLNVIAEGLGQFSFVVFEGGLPGDGWQKGNKRFFGKGNVTIFPITFTATAVEENGDRRELQGNEALVITCKFAAGDIVTEQFGTWKKIERKSPTLGQKAPEGAVVLFADGKASDLFTKADVNQKYQTLWSEAETKPLELRPYTLHVEFMTSYMPFARGQGRSNSGVYINQSYECQVLDSFGLEGKNNECGGFYQISEPKVNMCYPPLQWQTYDIDYTPATYDSEGKRLTKTKISVKHNGVLIQRDVEFDKETFVAPKKEGPEPGGLYLQGHGNRVQYRNIWLKYNEK